MIQNIFSLLSSAEQIDCCGISSSDQLKPNGIYGMVQCHGTDQSVQRSDLGGHARSKGLKTVSN